VVAAMSVTLLAALERRGKEATAAITPAEHMTAQAVAARVALVLMALRTIREATVVLVARV
tara:strand:- start:128 stop:310 length:183 start_codon:yes stop_codon:yes gene_type:complete